MNMKSTRVWFNPAILASVLLTILTSGAHAATLLWTNALDGTWNDTVATNWNPPQVPGNRDTVNITNSSAGNYTVDFATTKFTGTNALQGLKVKNPGGGTTTLQMGTGVTLQLTNGTLSIEAGGKLTVDTGAFISNYNQNTTAKVEVNGGTVVMTGGLVTMANNDFNINYGTWTHSGGLAIPQGVLVFANAASKTGTLTISGGAVSNGVYGMDATAGNSTFTISDTGLLSISGSSGNNVNVGTTGGTHLWTISGGLVNVRGGGTTFGNTTGNGSVTVINNGGVYWDNNMTVNRSATVTLSAGGITNRNSLNVNGTVNQTGGTMNNGTEANIGNFAGNTGVYNLVSGTLNMRGMHIGDVVNAIGTLTATAGVTVTTVNLTGGPNSAQTIAIGATSGSGEGNLILQGLNGIGGSFFSYVAINQTGKLQGWGTLSGTSFGIMHGKVIANGYGTDQTLDLTGRLFTNAMANTTDSGWYARNHGKLRLAPVPVKNTAASIYNWGQYTNDAAINYVNSARFEFTGLAGTGSITGAVLAVDRPEANAPDQGKVGAFEFGVSNATFTSCNLTLRYDDAVAGFNEPFLKLYQWTGATWDEVPITIDQDNNRVTTVSGVTSLGVFVLAYPHAAPIIVNRPATNIMTTSAWLNGYLTSTGDAPVTVAVYWGEQDGGATTSGLWQATNTWNPGDWLEGSTPTYQATPLTTDKFYYYRYSAWTPYATNSALASSNFLAGAVSVTALDAEASESGDTGLFEISRGSTATDLPTVVYYRFTGSAVLGTNYTLNPAGTTLTLAAGQTSAEITVNPLVDLVNLSDTVVTLELLPGAYAFGTTNASVTISNVTPPAAHAPTTLTWTDPASDTWTSFNTNHWTPTYVPANNDSVRITNAFANGVTVDYAAADFQGTNTLVNLTLSNSVAGQTNNLLLGSGDTLQLKGVTSIAKGGQLTLDSGALVSNYNNNATAQLNVDGGVVNVKGGTLTIGNSLLYINSGTWTQSGGTVIPQGSFSFANVAGQTATLNLSGGRIANTTFAMDATAGNSILSLSATGTLALAGGSANALNLGTTGGTHQWTISGGVLNATPVSFIMGSTSGNGSVTVTQTAGSVGTATMVINRSATYTLTGGGVTNGSMYMDSSFNQNGGTVYNSYDVYIGSAEGPTGVYNLVSGTLRTRGLNIGHATNAVGTLTVNAGTSFTPNSDGGSGVDSLCHIGWTNGAGVGTLEFKGLASVSGANGLWNVNIHRTGVLRGYGTLNGAAWPPFNMNGRIVADGYGAEQTLSLAAMPMPSNTLDNVVGDLKGYYAVNLGKLTLKSITVPTGASSALWGDTPAGPAPDLVNSVKLDFTGVTTGGTLTGSLLATNRTSDVPVNLYKPLGVWDFNGGALTGGTATLTFRYDDVGAQAASLDETGLKVWQYNGSAWANVTASVNTGTKLIVTSARSSLGKFAVGLPVPPRGTIFTIH